jgi:SNF2 family DNA or RNA helicase
MATFQLKEHQREAMEWLVNIEKNVAPHGGILADDMGLGKTLESLSVVLANPLPHTMIVVPASLVEQWVMEITRFAPKLKICIDVPEGDVTVTSYYKASHRKDLLEFSWDRVILDEGHVIRNDKTKTFKGLMSLKTKHRWILSGTPIQNGCGDLMNLLYFVGLRDFKEPDALQTYVEKFVLRRTKTGLKIEMPELKIFKHIIDFEDETDRKHYERLRYRWTKDKLELLLRLRQFTLLPKMVKLPEKCQDEEEENVVDYVLNCPKLNSVVKCVESNIETQKPIVFCHFKKEMTYIEEKLKSKGLKVGRIDGDVAQSKRTEIIAQHASIDVLLIQLMAGSTGLNLQMFNSVIFTAPHWNPTHEAQAICRAYRIGQNKDVYAHRFVIKNTIEQEIVDRQRVKKQIAKNYGLWF